MKDRSLESRVKALEYLIGLALRARGTGGGGGGVTAVTGSGLITSTGGTTPDITLPAGGSDGDVVTNVGGTPAWAPPTGGVTEVTATGPLTSTGGDTPDINIEDGSVDGDVMLWNGSAWVIGQLTMDQILPGFSIDSFSASGGTVEVGASVVNPTVSASYSTTPASASVTNTASIDSPLTLTTPFTSGTFVGTFTSSVPATVDTTLTATSPTSVVKQSTIALVTFAERVFWGIGAGGAVSATASGTEAVLNGGLGTLVDSQLNLPASFTGPTPTNNFIYFLCPHTATPHTFQDANGFAVPMGPGADGTPTTFSFTNVNGAVLSMDLYQSTNALMTVAYPITVH
jgi:hypothetical protein